MLILALDTTSEHGGVAVCKGNDCLATVLNEAPADRYAVTLFEMVDQVLAQARLSFRDIELYAVSNGPGSFTGIRVGLAAAQAWSRAFGKPLQGVTVLEAMAEQARPDTDWAVPVLDARRGEFFVGFYRRWASGGEGQNDRFQAIGEGQVVRPEQLPDLMDTLAHGGHCTAYSGGSITCLARAHDLKARAVHEKLGGTVTWTEVPSVLVDTIARVAFRAYEQGEVSSPDRLDAYYIRQSDAEMNWRA
jgi:tRNA threonylcarbamoyladenosine biosynthesis protein TsaB